VNGQKALIKQFATKYNEPGANAQAASRKKKEKLIYSNSGREKCPEKQNDRTLTEAWIISYSSYCVSKES
jgi:hypothetical protein